MLNYNLKSNRNGFFNIGLYQVVNQRKLFRLDTWRPSSLSELTPIIFKARLIDLGSEASICRFYLLNMGNFYHN